MDNFPENDQSTVFSAPEAHNDGKLKSPKKSRIITAVAAFLAVCVLVGGTVAVIKLIPKKEENASSEAKKISVIDFDKSKFDSVAVENKNGVFTFYPKTDDTDTKWYVKDLAEEKISIYKTGDIISSAAKIEAIMEITKKSFEDCGLNAPQAKVDVFSKELGNFYISLGSVSPDNSGIYLYCSVDEKIYLVSLDMLDSFEFTALDLANTDAVAPLSDKTELSSYFENGQLTSFDKLTVSGSNFMRPIEIHTLGEDEESIGFTYKVTSPVNRYADMNNIGTILAPFASGISVSGVYSLDTDAASLNAFGLNNPDIILSLMLGKQTFTYKFALQSDGSYALFGDGMNTIKKISPSSAEFLSINEDDLYNKLVYIRNISELKNMTFKTDGKVYSFDISENGEDADEKYTVIYGDKTIKSQYFQNFYMHFISLSLIDFSSGNLKNADMTVEITDNSSKTETLGFYKASATEYYCVLDGTPIGKITASSYNKLLSDLKTVSENKDVGDR